ncbi:SLC13 family permease [Glaciecola petra]|uniref:SLC13 family permease n=1 Tax=Glaciecola petra TaxID=3075602 RepID=A0ABU2ZPN7_9ALTE|nr:SLC13 family permease [Aestuariibacter sp. P117]MDT0594236.1 SLC13 family permease [Aestuariibacter sp. P117]
MSKHFAWFGPLLALICFFTLDSFDVSYKVAITAAIALLTVIWWVTEPVPIAITSLVPFVLLPLFNVLDHKSVSAALGSHVILLLMGAFMLSKALERSGVHKRLAILMVRAIGVSSKRRLVFAFMVCTAALSMWISNTATILVVLPIALAILDKINDKKLQIALILGIAYSASVGGLGTLIGTPPNVIFAGIYEAQTGSEYSFVKWMSIGIPVVIVAIPIMALWLTRSLKGPLHVELPNLGEWQIQEKRTLILFGLAVLAWITRNAPFGGWSDLLGVEVSGDSTVALFFVVVMFLTPDGRGQKVLDLKSAMSIPWEMLLLFAGGIALAKGFTASGLSEIIGQSLSSLADMPVLITILLLCLLVTYLTEIISNTAAATLLMPILYLVAVNQGVSPEVLMIPAAMAASCAFMLPVATAPNAIAYGTGKFEIQDMVKEGAVLSFAVSCLIGLLVYVLI